MSLDRKVPLYLKVAAVVGAVLFVSALGQRSLIRWALAPFMAELRASGVIEREGALLSSAVRPRMVFAIGAPLFACAIGTGWVLGVLSRRRMRPLVVAMRAVAQGSLDEPLPPPPDRDFTEVREAFETMRTSLADALDRLAQADAQRRRLFSDLAHELATPTSAVIGLADTLGSPALCKTEEDRVALIASLEGEALRMARLVSDLRDLAELDDPDVPSFEEPVDLGSRIAETAARFAVLDGALLEVSCEEARISADPSRIEQILANLITNARRHTPPTGRILVQVVASPGAGTLIVEDSGPGVPEELVGRLGERLFRLDPSRDRRTGGSGLGLSIVRQIARRHRATVTFDRGELGGLRATVVFPSIA